MIGRLGRFLTPPRSVSDARVDVESLRKAERELEIRLKAVEGQRASAVEAAGSAVLAVALQVEVTPVGSALGLPGALLVECDAILAAIDQVRAERRAAILAVWGLEAEEMQSRASGLRKAADARGARSAELLADLTALEEVDYVPRGFEPTVLGPASMFPLPVMAQRLSRTARERGEAASLTRQAVELLTRRVVDTGSVSATTIDELVTEATGDPWRLGPRSGDVRDWCAEQTGTVVRWVLSWRAGTIDRRISRVEHPEPAPEPWDPRASIRVS